MHNRSHSSSWILMLMHWTVTLHDCFDESCFWIRKHTKHISNNNPSFWINKTRRKSTHNLYGSWAHGPPYGSEFEWTEEDDETDELALEINNNFFCLLRNLISFLDNWISSSSFKEVVLPLFFEVLASLVCKVNDVENLGGELMWSSQKFSC